MITDTGVRVAAVVLILLTSAVCSALPVADSTPLAKDGPIAPRDLPWPYGTGVPGSKKASVDNSKGSTDKGLTSDDLNKHDEQDEEDQEEESKASIEVTPKKGAESSYSQYSSRGRGKYGYGPEKDEDEEEEEDNEGNGDGGENEDVEEKEKQVNEEEKEENGEEKAVEEEEDEEKEEEGAEDEDDEEEDDSSSEESDEDENDDKEIANKKELTRGYYRKAEPGYIPPHFRVATSVTSSVSAVYGPRTNRYRYRSLKKGTEGKKKEEKENEEGIDKEKDGEEDGEENSEKEEKDDEEGNDNEIEEQDGAEEREEVERKTAVHPFFTIASSSSSGKNEHFREGIHKKNEIKGYTNGKVEEAELSKEEENKGGKYVGLEEQDEEEEEEESDEDQDDEGSSSEEDSPAFIVLNNDKHGRSNYGRQNFKLEGNPDSSKISEELLLFLPVVDKSSSSVSRVRALSSKLSRTGKPLDLHPAALGEHIEGYVTSLDHEDTAHFIGALTKVLDDDDSRSNEEDEQEDIEGDGRRDDIKDIEGMTFPAKYPEMRKKMTLSPGGTGRTFTVYRRAQNSQAGQRRAEVPSHFRATGHSSQSSQRVTSNTSNNEPRPREISNIRKEAATKYSSELDHSEETIRPVEIKSKPETIIITARPIYPSSEVTTEKPRSGLTKEKIQEITKTYSDFLSKYRESRVRKAQSMVSSTHPTITRDNSAQFSESSILKKSDSSIENVTPKSSLAILESMQLEKTTLDNLLKKISGGESDSSSEMLDKTISESMETFLTEFQIPEPVRINVAESFFRGFSFSEALEDPNVKITSIPMPILVNLTGQVLTGSSSPLSFASAQSTRLRFTSDKKVSEDISTEDENLDSAEDTTQHVNPTKMQLSVEKIQSPEQESMERDIDSLEQIDPMSAQSAETSVEITKTNVELEKSDKIFHQQTLSIESSTDLSKEESKIDSIGTDNIEDLLQLSLESTEHILTQGSSEKELAARLSLQQYGLPQEESTLPVTRILDSLQGTTNTRINSPSRQQTQNFKGSTNLKQLESSNTQSVQDLLLHTQLHQGETLGRSGQSPSNTFVNQMESAINDGHLGQQEAIRIIQPEGKSKLSQGGEELRASEQLQKNSHSSSLNTFATGREHTSTIINKESSLNVLERPSALKTNIEDAALKTKNIETTITELHDINSGSSSHPGILQTSSIQQPQITETNSDFAEIGDQIDKLPSKQISESSFTQIDSHGTLSKSSSLTNEKVVGGLKQQFQSRGKSLSQTSQASIAPQLTEKSRETIQKEFTAKLMDMIENQSKLATLSKMKNETSMPDKPQKLLPETENLSMISLSTRSKGTAHTTITEEPFTFGFTPTEQAEISSTILPLREQLKRLRERVRLETEQLAGDSQIEKSGSQQDNEKSLQSQREEMQRKFTDRLRDMIEKQSKQNEPIVDVTDKEKKMSTQSHDSHRGKEIPTSLRSQVDALKQNVQLEATATPDTMIHVTVSPFRSSNKENTTETTRKLMQKEFTTRLTQMINEQSKVIQQLPVQRSPLSDKQVSNNMGAEVSKKVLGKETIPSRQQVPREFTSRLRQMVKNQTRTTESTPSVPRTESVSRPDGVQLDETHIENIRLPAKSVSESSSVQHQHERLRQMRANRTESEDTRLPFILVPQLPSAIPGQDESQRDITQNEFTAQLKQKIANQTETHLATDSSTSGHRNELTRATMQRKFRNRLQQMVANQTISKDLGARGNSNQQITQVSANSAHQQGSARDKMQSEFTAKLRQMVANQTAMEAMRSEVNSNQHVNQNQEETPRRKMQKEFTAKLRQMVANQTAIEEMHSQGHSNEQVTQIAVDSQQQQQAIVRDKMQKEFTAKLKEMVANQTQKMAEQLQLEEKSQTDAQRQLMQDEFTARLQQMVKTVSEKNLRSQNNKIASEGVSTISSLQVTVGPSGESEIVRLMNQQDNENDRSKGVQKNLDESLRKVSDSQMNGKQHSLLQADQIPVMNMKQKDSHLPTIKGQTQDVTDQRELLRNEQRLFNQQDMIKIGKDLETHTPTNIQSQKENAKNPSRVKHLPSEFLVSDIDGTRIETVPARRLSPNVLLSSLSARDERVLPSQVILLPEDELKLNREPARQLAPERLRSMQNLGKIKGQMQTPDADSVSSVQSNRHQQKAKMSGQRIKEDLNRGIGQRLKSQVTQSQQEVIRSGFRNGNINWQSGRHVAHVPRNQENAHIQTQIIRGRQHMSAVNVASQQPIGKAITEQQSKPFIEEQFIVKLKNKHPRGRHEGRISNQPTHHRIQSQRQIHPLPAVLNPAGKIHASQLLSDRQASIEAMQALAGQSIAFPASRPRQAHARRPQSASVDTPNVTTFRPHAVSRVRAPSGHISVPKNIPETTSRNVPFARELHASQQTKQHITRPISSQNPTMIKQQQDFIVKPLNEPTRTRQQSDFVVRPSNEPAGINVNILHQQRIHESLQQNFPLPLIPDSQRIQHQHVAATQQKNSANIPTVHKHDINFPTEQFRFPKDELTMGPLVTLDPNISKARQFTRFRIPGTDPSTENSKLVRNNSRSANSRVRTSSSVTQNFTPSSNNRARPINNSRFLPNIRHASSLDSEVQDRRIQMVTDLINGDIRALNTRLDEGREPQFATGQVSSGRGRNNNDKQVQQSPDNVSVLPNHQPEILSANVQVRSPSGKLYVVPRTFLAEFYEGSDNNPFGDPTLRISQAKALLGELLQSRRTKRAASSKSTRIRNEHSVREESHGSGQFGFPVSTSDETILQSNHEDEHSSETTLTRPHVVYSDDGAYLVQSDGQKILLENAVHVRYH